MATVLRIESLTGVPYNFSEMEIGRVRVWPWSRRIQLESQLGDPHIYDANVEHYWVSTEFITVFQSTIARLNLLRMIRDRFWIYPHYNLDAAVRYCVAMWDRDEIAEAYRHGLPEADQIIKVVFREFVGEVCTPPSVEGS